MVTVQDRFAACAEIVMARRGAFLADDPLVDGPSAHGIGLGLLSVWLGGPADASALRALGPDEAARILRPMVWGPSGAGHLPPGPDLALFAFAVEAGTMRALTDLQRELGVEESGAPDVPTIDAARACGLAALAHAIAAAHATWRSTRGLGAERPSMARRHAVTAC